MYIQYIFTWKNILAVGGAVMGIILACKVKPEQAKEALGVMSNAFSGANALIRQ